MRGLPLLLVLSGGCLFHGKKEEVGEDNGWTIKNGDLGANRAVGVGYQVGNGADLWFAAEQFVPEIEWSYPATGIPLYMWEDVAMGANVADVGACPYAVSSGAELTWKSDCRSSGGYEWSGELVETTWDDDIGRWTRWDMDLQILGDNDDPSFDRLELDGSILFVVGDGEPLDRAAKVNLRTGVEGFWVQRDVNDKREEAWADLAITGNFEQRNGGDHRIEGKVDLGGYGGLSFSAAALEEAEYCSTEHEGTITLMADKEVLLKMDGETACDRCAELTVNGEYAGRTCGI